MIVIFTGPTLDPKEAGKILDAVYLPPVSQGDVYRAALHRPAAIGIIDGYFDQVPAVWHKEILWALSEGIAVYGSASMGALRAAELSSFGMIGVGKIFEAYQSGVLEDDDEVAVSHGPADSGYRCFSEPLVNIRSTVAAAEASGIICQNTGSALIRLAKELYYPDRNYEMLNSLARRSVVRAEELNDFSKWLVGAKVNQKRADALAMLAEIKNASSITHQNSKPGFTFEYTTLWEELRRSAGQLSLQTSAETRMLPEDGVLDEMRLSGIHNWCKLRRSALVMVLARIVIGQQGTVISEDEIFESILKFRNQKNLKGAEDFLEWMINNNLSQSAFIRLMENLAAVDYLSECLQTEVSLRAADIARLDDSYPELAARALAKRQILESVDSFAPDLAVYEDALSWFAAEQRVRGKTPEEICQLLDFTSFDDFRRAVVGEYLYYKQENFS